MRSLTAVSVPHPAAYTAAFRVDPEQKERSAYIRLFWQEGKAEEVLLADDARRLRRMYDVENSGISPETVDEYVAVLSAPGALTAALNWYRAMSSDSRVDKVEVPTTYVWSDADVAIGRTAAEACASSSAATTASWRCRASRTGSRSRHPSSWRRRSWTASPRADGGCQSIR